MIAKFVKSLGYALKGIFTGIKEERNVRIDIVAAFYVLVFSNFYDFTVTQKVLLVFICFTVIGFELMNTAVERAVDKPDKEHWLQAGAAKDTAAGGVLLVAIGAATAGIMLFWDVEVFKEIFGFFTSHPVMAVCLLITFFASYKFITYDNRNDR
ncbi:MAG: diacylglycerol kinase family protein [Oscillospiraceae bacterium]|nr:diacylglycerol kinase family protein [Oscillospiraceae bacterium]